MRRFVSLSVTVVLLSALSQPASAADPMQAYKDAAANLEALWEQAYACKWDKPFASAALLAERDFILDLADLKIGPGTGEKIRPNTSKAAAKPCGSKEDQAAQGRAVEIVFDWANRLAAMQQIGNAETWAKEIVDIAPGLYAIEAWRSNIQKELIAKRGQQVWADYIKRIQGESFQELALICPERANSYSKSTRQCPKIPPEFAAALPLAKIRIVSVEWLSKQLVKNKKQFDNGEDGSPFAFEDMNPATMDTLSTYNFGPKKCQPQSLVVYPSAHTRNPDGTISAVVRKYLQSGAFGIVKIKRTNLDYKLLEADATALQQGLVEGEFKECSEK